MEDSTKEFLAGTFGGFVGKIVEFPMDTVKVLMQTEDPKVRRYKSSFDCLRQVAAEGGLSSLYRGLTVPLLGSMAEISTLMTSYGFVKRLLTPPTRDERQHSTGLASDIAWWKRILAGGSAGVGVSMVLTPVELIKCRLQVDAHRAAGQAARYKGPIDCIVNTIMRDGLAGLFRGNASTLMREVPGNVCWFGCYEVTCDFFRRRQRAKMESTGNETSRREIPLHPLVYIAAGAMAGVGYWTAFFPADVVKSRIQTGRGLEGIRRSSNSVSDRRLPRQAPFTFWTVFRYIYRTEGILGLYSGWLITVARAAPSNAAVFFAYEMFMKTLNSDYFNRRKSYLHTQESEESLNGGTNAENKIGGNLVRRQSASSGNPQIDANSYFDLDGPVRRQLRFHSLTLEEKEKAHEEALEVLRINHLRELKELSDRVGQSAADEKLIKSYEEELIRLQKEVELWKSSHQIAAKRHALSLLEREAAHRDALEQLALNHEVEIGVLMQRTHGDREKALSELRRLHEKELQKITQEMEHWHETHATESYLTHLYRKKNDLNS